VLLDLSAMNRVGVAETAFAQRAARFQVLLIGGWDDPADDELGRRWVRDLHAAIGPHGMVGSFLNFNSADDGGLTRVRAAFGPNWDRLLAVKRRYDPTNVFRCNNNIR
jgi:hypothetical protein